MQAPGESDRRQRRLALTEQGVALERRLFERQRETVMRAYREAGPADAAVGRMVAWGVIEEPRPTVRGIDDGVRRHVDDEVAATRLAERRERALADERITSQLAALAALQLLTGLSNIVLQWPLVAAVAHTGGAAALVVGFTGALLSVQGRATPRPQHPPISSTTGRPA